LGHGKSGSVQPPAFLLPGKDAVSRRTLKGFFWVKLASVCFDFPAKGKETGGTKNSAVLSEPTVKMGILIPIFNRPMCTCRRKGEARQRLGLTCFVSLNLDPAEPQKTKARVIYPGFFITGGGILINDQ
jgi:hypothetical protein